ncbi:MAG: hypothetical protein KIT22_10625 [Verrucomicrobiae bacterium]|nr:hypothetical protein [Verrucomicrobiae bacterium]
MKPTRDIEELLDAARRRRLTVAEAGALRQSLTADPESRQRLEEELALNRALDSQPIPAVSSNFLARVEARLAAEESAQRRSFWHWRWRFLAPAIPVVALTLALGGWWQHRVRQQRTVLAASLATLAPGGAIPGLESLQDFDAVQWLRSGPVPGDVELLAALALDADPSASLP